MRHCRVTANPADKDLVTAYEIERQRNFALAWIVEHYNARRLAQGFAGLIRRNRIVEFDVDRLGMPDPDGNTSRRGRHLNAVIAHDLFGFAHHLPFFLGVAVFTGFPIMRQDIAGELSGMGGWLGNRFAAAYGCKLGVKFEEPRRAFARGSLVGGHDDPFDAGQIVERLKGHDHLMEQFGLATIPLGI